MDIVRICLLVRSFLVDSFVYVYFHETQNCMHDMLLLLLSCRQETASRLVYQKNSEYRCYVDIVVVT